MDSWKKNSPELKAWLIMLAIAFLLTGVGLLLFILSGVGTASDFFADLAGVSPWMLVALVVLMGAGVFLLTKMADKPAASHWDTKQLVVAALCIALSFVLSYIKIYELPNGGSITPASMLPILLFAYIYGPVKGFLVAFAYSLLQMTQGMYIVHWAQFLLDYVFAFTVLGAAGFFRKSFLSGILAGGLLRYLCAFLSGVIFFAEYAPEGQSPFVYSLLYNASYMVPEILICMGIYLLPGMRRTVDMLKAQETAHAEGAKKA